MESVKAQPTLRGFNAYVLQQLVDARGLTVAEVAAWIIEQWIDSNMEVIEQRYGISIDRFQQSRAVGVRTSAEGD